MDEAGVQEFVESVKVIETVIAQLVRDNGRDSSVLYGSEIEKAVSRIVASYERVLTSTGRPQLDLVLAGLGAVARLHYARYHSDPAKPAGYLWSAVQLFGVIRSAPREAMTVPQDIVVILDVLSAGDPVAAPGVDGPITAIDTSARLVEYAGVNADLDALRRAEALVRWGIEMLPLADPRRVIGQHNLLGVLARRWEMTGIDLTDEVVALVDAVTDPGYRNHPQWPHLLTSAGSALYVAATRTSSRALLDRCIDLLAQGLAELGDKRAESGYLQNLGRAELAHWAWYGGSGRPDKAIVCLQRAADCAVPGTPQVTELHGWLSLALLSGDQPEPAEAARHLDAAFADRLIPGRFIKPGLLAQVSLMLWRVGPKDDAVLNRAIDLLIEAESKSMHYETFSHADDLVDALWERWERTRDIGDVDEVIGRLASRAEAANTPPLLLNLLARSLRARWERTGDSAAIRQAITCLSRAVEHTNAPDPATAMYLHNLGVMWLRLYEASADEGALDEAVRNITSALDRCAEGADLPMFASNGAIARLKRWELRGGDADLHESVRLAQLAATVTPEDHPDWAAHLANHGSVMLQAAMYFGGIAPLNAAVSSLEAAVGGVPATRPGYGAMMLSLGEALQMQGKFLDDPAVISRGRDLIRESVDYPYVRPVDAIRALRRWGEEAAAFHEWQAAAAAMSDAVARLANLPGHRLARSDHERLLSNLTGLATDAAAACLNDGGNEHHALECLEAGRGVLLAKALSQDRVLAELQRRDAPLAQRVQDIQALLAAG